MGFRLREEGESEWNGREGNTEERGAGTFHVADAAITFAKREIGRMQD